MLDRSCGSFLKVLLYDYNLNCKWITLCCWLLKILACCYRRNVIVQVGLVCVEGCGVGSTYLSLPTVYAAVYDKLLGQA